MKKADLQNQLDAWYEEIEQGSAEIRNGLTYQQVRAKIDRWEHIRSLSFKSEVIINRAYRDSKKKFDDRFRKEASNRNIGIRNGDLAYEERREYYITTCFDEYRALRLAEEMRAELHDFLGYIKDKMFWIYQVQRELLREDDNVRFVRGMEYNNRVDK